MPDSKCIAEPLGGGLAEVEFPPRPISLFERILEASPFEELQRAAQRGRLTLKDRTVWQVNSTAHGGGVAEMLESLVPYFTAAGIRSRWLVIEGNEEFFEVTKRIHNLLHGANGDGGELGDAERRVYEQILDANEAEVLELVKAGDVVIFNDPQTAGLIKTVRRAGAHTMWRCHVGADTANDLTRAAWDFLMPYVDSADAVIFSIKDHVWDVLDESKVVIIPPSIDAFSPKNREMGESAVRAILRVAKLFDEVGQAPPSFIKADGSEGRVKREAKLVDGGNAVPAEAPVILQVSRWDGLKDPLGVVRGFACSVAIDFPESHLLLAGPEVSEVADDPEGAEVLEGVIDTVGGLPEQVRRRVHLAALPMEDDEENSAIVNALQRRADVVVQKSLAEGFGLTVSEAMWKGRPVVASGVGGIKEQIEDGISGLMVDPKNLKEFGEAVGQLLGDRRLSEEMGRNARSRVRDRFLDSTHLTSLTALAVDLIE